MPVTILAYIASAVVLRPAGDSFEFLLLRRAQSLAGEWCQVVGSIEPGETAWAAALREMEEETGLAPESYYSADICEQFYDHRRDLITMGPVFLAFVAEGAEPRLNEEHSDYRWVGLETAMDMVGFGGQRRVLRWIEAEFLRRTPNRHLRIDLPER